MIIRRIALLSLLPLVAGCATLFGRGAVHPQYQWPITLTTVRTALVADRISEADAVLIDFSTRYPGTPEQQEATYWRAVVALHGARRGTESLDSAAAHLDRYLELGDRQPRYYEAVALRQLVGQTRQMTSELGRVRQALSQARDDTARQEPAREASRPERNLAAEVESLRAELNRANQELERIRRRLAGQNP